jgi:hypothetical protein
MGQNKGKKMWSGRIPIQSEEVPGMIQAKISKLTERPALREWPVNAPGIKNT